MSTRLSSFPRCNGRLEKWRTIFINMMPRPGVGLTATDRWIACRNTGQITNYEMPFDFLIQRIISWRFEIVFCFFLQWYDLVSYLSPMRRITMRSTQEIYIDIYAMNACGSRWNGWYNGRNMFSCHVHGGLHTKYMDKTVSSVIHYVL